MKAIVAVHPGTPDVLKLQELPLPAAKPGWVLIQVKAFGLNRAELFTRQGDSLGVKFPASWASNVLALSKIRPTVISPKDKPWLPSWGAWGVCSMVAMPSIR